MSSQEYLDILLKRGDLTKLKLKTWFAEDSAVYHVCPKCTSGNDIEVKNLRYGDPGNRRVCEKCKKRRKNGTCY